ncbi:MAG: sulfocyanin-like copper-binding protein, partial [Actinomycetota bacterium]
IDSGAALAPGATKVLTADLSAGHYALVCNLSGHYKAGMHVDFWVTPKGATPVQVGLDDSSSTQMSITLSSTTAPEGQVAFIVTNESTDMKHELVGFQTKTPAGAYAITGFEGDPNRIDEDTAGKVVIDSGAALAPGATKVLTADLSAGHYALVCNLSGHYKAGMHVDFWVTPPR